MKIIVKPRSIFWKFVITDDNGKEVFASQTFFDKPAAIYAARVAADFLLQGHGQIEIQDAKGVKHGTA